MRGPGCEYALDVNPHLLDSFIAPALLELIA